MHCKSSLKSIDGIHNQLKESMHVLYTVCLGWVKSLAAELWAFWIQHSK